MAVTKSWETAVAQKLDFERKRPAPERRREGLLLLGATLLVACGLALVFAAKTQDFGELSRRLESGELLNLNTTAGTEEIAAMLERAGTESAGERVWGFIEQHRPLANVGALARVLRLGRVKPLVVVRTPREYALNYLLWTGLYLAGFWVVHLAWRARRFRGDGFILPALQLLTGIGLILMVSLRDPLRDTLDFKKFSWGVLLGCGVLLLPLLRPFQYSRFPRWTYTPLLAAFVLFGALLRFGSGPTGSDAKVNLGPFQPVELIKVLLVFFLAGYFAEKWERLRDLRQKSLVPRWLSWLELPRASHALPVMCGVACSLVLFFVLKDMGPALVVGFVFLTMFAVARGKAGLALLGVAALIGGVAAGCHFGTPHTVVERVAMWLSPWNNDVRGGDQLAHSLWAFSTGGPWGSGPGWGDPAVIPAGHTDLVLSSIAEEWGLAGVLSIAALFAVLVERALRIARRAPDEYASFLALGLGALIALEMLLISGGALGAIPLSGVVSPFLSLGNTAMLANFLIAAVLVSISQQTARQSAADRAAEEPEPENLEAVWRRPLAVVAWTLGACACLLVLRAGWIEVLHDRELLVKDTLVYTQDGVKRPEHNPRLSLLAASIPRGNIYDRNGVLLATSNWGDLEKRRAEYERLGVNLAELSRVGGRWYPFGGATVHLLGDWRTGAQFHASNSSLIEHDSNVRLQGYRDYTELAPVVRYRHQRANPVLQALLKRDRDVRASIDVRLQKKASEILQARLGRAGKKGALVVMDATNGDLLAAVSWPEPPGSGAATPDELLDRARYGQYPPGSTFKLVTAMAALRLDPKATAKTYSCRRLGDGRVGTIIPGWRRPIRDDAGDHAHGALSMAGAITVSCNAYFAQLGVFAVGARALRETAGVLGIPAGEEAEVKQMLPFAAYGQGPVVTTPFKMARVAATIAAGGEMAQGRWILDGSNTRADAPQRVLEANSALFLGNAMRSVVTSGTARSALGGLDVTVAGKTGTAQLDEGAPHSWFAGFAPFEGDAARRLAFAVVVEHGGYGAKSAAPIARELVQAAEELKLVESGTMTGKR